MTLIRGIPITNQMAFYMFLLAADDVDLPQVLDTLGIENTIKLIKHFGGRSLEVPTLQHFDKCLRYFQILEYIHKSGIKLGLWELDAKSGIMAKFNMSEEEIDELRRYAKTFKTNFPTVFRDLLKGNK